MALSAKILRTALVAAALLPLAVGAQTSQPQMNPAPGWVAMETRHHIKIYVPPGAVDASTYAFALETTVSGSLRDTLNAAFHRLVSDERVQRSVYQNPGSTGVPTLGLIVTTVDRDNNTIYRVLLAKQFGSQVAVGELYSTSESAIRTYARSGLEMLNSMSLSGTPGEIAPYHATEIAPAHSSEIATYHSTEITPYHATLITPAPKAGVDVAGNQGAPPAGLSGLWALKVPGVAYTTSVTYGELTEETLHVHPGAAGGYLKISGRKYTWYGPSGDALSHGALVRVIPHNYADPKKSYWRVYEGREEHYIVLDGGSITVYDPGTNFYSFVGSRI